MNIKHLFILIISSQMVYQQYLLLYYQVILPGYITNKNSNKKSNKKIISYYPYIENCYKNKDFQQVIKNSEKKQSLIYDNNICIKGPYKIAYIEIKKIMDEKKL